MKMKIFSKNLNLILIAYWLISITSGAHLLLSEMNNNALKFESYENISGDNNNKQVFMDTNNNNNKISFTLINSNNNHHHHLNAEIMKKIDESSQKAFKKLKSFYRIVSRSRFG